MAVDGAGNMYVADYDNNVVRKIDASGTISTFAGIGTAGYSGNGGAAILAKLRHPVAVAADAAGNIYIADNENNVVRVVNAAGIISNFAGNGIAGYVGDGDTSHLGSLNGPAGLAFDAAGNMYIADASNNVIRMVAVGTHILSTFAGNGSIGNSGDGGLATAAQLFSPSGVAVNTAGDVYIADILNNKVRKVAAATGIISTFAGTGAAGNSGDGGMAAAATMKFPSSVALDMGGNVYITDQGNNNVRIVNSAGIINHFAGQSTSGYDGDGGLAANAKLASPRAVYVDGWNRIYIVDYNNHVIRNITATASVAVTGSNGVLSVYPNPSTGMVYLNTAAIKGVAAITVTDITGRIVLSTATLPSIQLGHLADGVYTISVVAADGKHTARVLLQHSAN
jgi:sugar lactone lactonase YvrE